MKDYYLTAGVERRFSSAGKDCLYIIRAQPKSWISLWFVSINITLPPGTVSIYLKNAFGIFSDYHLTSNDTGRVRNFDSMTPGYWFEIRSANASFELKFLSYTNGKLIESAIIRIFSEKGRVYCVITSHISLILVEKLNLQYSFLRCC